MHEPPSLHGLLKAFAIGNATRRIATDGRLEPRDGNVLKELLAQRGARADATGQGLQPRRRRRTLGLARGHGLARRNGREPLLLALLRLGGGARAAAIAAGGERDGRGGRFLFQLRGGRVDAL